VKVKNISTEDKEIKLGDGTYLLAPKGQTIDVPDALVSHYEVWPDVTWELIPDKPPAKASQSKKEA
jgi:hypothetical protein